MAITWHVGKRKPWHEERPERLVQLGPHFRSLLCSKAKIRLDFLFSWSTLKAARAHGNYDVILQALLLFQTGTVISHVSYVHQHVLTERNTIIDDIFS